MIDTHYSQFYYKTAHHITCFKRHSLYSPRKLKNQYNIKENFQQTVNSWKAQIDTNPAHSLRRLCMLKSTL